MGVESVLLTGGASKRMGQDKASLLVHGVPQAEWIAQRMQDHGLRVTVLGKTPLKGLDFLPDPDPCEGPLHALTRFEPTEDMVFVVSCDIPHFDAGVIDLLRDRLGPQDAAIPEVDECPQPLCALYRATAWPVARQSFERGDRRVMDWVEHLRVAEVGWAEFLNFGVDPVCVRSADSPEDLIELGL